MKNNQELKEKIDTIDKKLNLLYRKLDFEFKEIECRDIKSHANSIAFALLATGGLAFTAFIALNDRLLIVFAFVSWFIGIGVQLHGRSKIKKLKQKNKKNRVNH